MMESRLHNPSVSKHSSRRGGRATPPSSHPPHQTQSQVPPASYQPQTSLPSIRQLHPYLPPSGMSQQILPAIETSGYGVQQSYQPAAGSSNSGNPPQQSSSHTANFGPALSSPDGDLEQPEQEPPKKKRRRQALSCTECKRRKVKCDRSQPCTPCTRRGEQNKCQWHIVELVEKYVQRVEFEDLKAKHETLQNRFDDMHALLSRLVSESLGPMGVGGYPMSLHQGLAAGTVDPGPSPYHTPAPGPVVYHPGISHPQYSQHHDSAHPLGQFTKPDTMSPPTTRHHQPQTPSVMLMPPQSASTQLSRPAGSLPNVPSHPHLQLHPQPQQTRSPPMSSGSGGIPRASLLSLSSITSPFDATQATATLTTPTEAQSKNFHAQTLMMGERLRADRPVLEGPATRIRTPIPTNITHNRTLLPLPYRSHNKNRSRTHSNLRAWSAPQPVTRAICTTAEPSSSGGYSQGMQMSVSSPPTRRSSDPASLSLPTGDQAKEGGGN